MLIRFIKLFVVIISFLSFMWLVFLIGIYADAYNCSTSNILIKLPICTEISTRFVIDGADYIRFLLPILLGVVLPAIFFGRKWFKKK